MDEVRNWYIEPRHGFRCPARMPAGTNPNWPESTGMQCGDYAGHDGGYTLLTPTGAPWSRT
jgi:hypothetical protein